ncbi:MAG: ribosome maturation factor RimM [Cytophagaceae bacterium]
MNKDACYNLGKIIKTHGLKGEFLIKLDVDDPEDYLDMESVFVELNQKLVPFFIQNIRLARGSEVIIHFEDVSQDTAPSLINADLYLPLDNLPELEAHQFYYHEIIGFTVSDKKLGMLGKIIGVAELPGHDLLQMEYNGQEVFLPLHDDFILRADKNKSVLHTDLPDGLMDIFLTDNNQQDDGDED